MTGTQLEPDRYLASVDADTTRLIDVASRDLSAEVPPCPGWTVADVVSHVAVVYEHKVRVMRDNGWPKPWPPPEFAEREPLAFLSEAKTHLFAELDRHDLLEETTTFSAADTTIAFWVRRMALEIAVHRLDGELAVGDPTPIAEDIATDGIDEILEVMLGGPWWSDFTTEYPLDAAVAVETGSHRWRCALSTSAVEVSHDDGSTGSAVLATVSGAPDPLFRWLWGRTADDAVQVDGDRDAVRQLRGRLTECTG